MKFINIPEIKLSNSQVLTAIDDYLKKMGIYMDGHITISINDNILIDKCIVSVRDSDGCIIGVQKDIIKENT